MNELVPTTSATLPALVAASGDRVGMRFLELFAANIRNLHTRRAYARAAREFGPGVRRCLASIEDIFCAKPPAIGAAAREGRQASRDAGAPQARALSRRLCGGRRYSGRKSFPLLRTLGGRARKQLTGDRTTRQDRGA
jgi:hypothetical protein